MKVLGDTSTVILTMVLGEFVSDMQLSSIIIDFGLTKCIVFLSKAVLFHRGKGRGGICPKCPILDPPLYCNHIILIFKFCIQKL